MLSDEATRAHPDPLVLWHKTFPSPFSQASQNFDDRHKFSSFLISLGLEALQATPHHSHHLRWLFRYGTYVPRSLVGLHLFSSLLPLVVMLNQSPQE